MSTKRARGVVNTNSHHQPYPLELRRIPIIQFCHRAIFALIVFVLIYSVLAYGTTQAWNQGPLVVAIMLAAVFWSVRLLVAHEAQVVFSPLGAPLILTSGYVIARYVLAKVEFAGRSNMVLTVAAVLFFFIVLNDIRHRWQITTLVWVVTGLGAVLAVLGFCQVLTGGHWVLGQPQFALYRGRASGTFFRPADLAVYLQIALALAGANFILSRRTPEGKKGLAFVGLVIGGGLLLTFSLWHWISWGAALGVLALFAVRKRTWHFRWVIAGGGVLLVVVATMVTEIRRIQSHPIPAEAGESFRKDVQMLLNPPALDSRSQLSQRALWKSAMSIGQVSVLMGAGSGMIPNLFPNYRSFQGRMEHCPNLYLDVYAEYGVIGIALLLWLAVVCGLSMIRILRLRDIRYSEYRLSNRYAFVVAGLAILAVCAVDGGFDLNLHTSGGLLFPIVTIMAAALTCGVHRRVNEEGQQHQHGRHTSIRLYGPSRYVVVAGLGGLVLLLGTNSIKTYPAELLLRRGQHALDQMDWDKAEKSFQFAWRFDRRSCKVAEALGDLNLARATWNRPEREALSAKAIEWYNRALTLNQYAYDVRAKIARLNDALEGNSAQALADYRLALDVDPHNASYHVLLGQHYWREGDTAEAQNQFQMAHDLGATETTPVDERAK